ncbi:MAG TPA: hypothetical protein VIU40_04290 [Geobacteraceae bacterium]
MTRYRRFLMFLPLVVLLASCTGIPAYRVEGELAGQRVGTTVDSEAAKYYLENYLAGDRSHPRYAPVIASALEAWDRYPLDAGTLRGLAGDFSPDFATIYFISRIYGEPCNRRAHQLFRNYQTTLRGGGTSRIAPPDPRPTRYLFAFVPGFAYRREPAIGADFARQRRLMMAAGFKTFLIETDEVGTVERNAAFIADELVRLGREHDEIILVSTSKGGAEAALALGKLLKPGQAAKVKAWVSVGGLLRGTPIADRALRWPRSWWTRVLFFFLGLPAESIESLGTKRRGETFRQLTFPGHMLLVQYVGVPLSGQVSPLARDRYEALRSAGPNDGLTLLPDELVPGGVVITDIGLDHYYRDPEIDLKSLALANAVLDLLDEEERCR